MRRRTAVTVGIGSLVVLAIVVAGVFYFTRQGLLPANTSVTEVSATTQTITRGEYLARAGDCVACHSQPNGKQFAGGRPMATPFGNFYVPNITPDDDTGIGKWTSD